MSQTEEFVKIVEAAKESKGVIFVTGKPGSGKSKVLREAAEDKKWDYVDCRLLISEEFLAVPKEERNEKAPAMMGEALASYNSEVILLDRYRLCLCRYSIWMWLRCLKSWDRNLFWLRPGPDM